MGLFKRRAPVVSPYPAAADDCYDVYNWVLGHRGELGVDRERIAVGGDSAGGNLTAVITLMARDRGLKMPCFQMLIYPVTDRRMQTPSTFEYENTPVWSGRQSKKMWKFYLPVLPKEHLDYASPIEAPTLSGLPSAYLEVADVDSLRDEGLAYGEKLKNDGVKVEIFRTVGTPHGFEIVQKSQITQDAVAKRCDALRRAFEN